MVIKLKLLVLLATAVLASNCSTNKKIKSSSFYVKQDAYINSYKTAFICGCINGATNDSLKKFMIANNDPGLFSDIETISYFTVKEADSLGKAYAKKIKPINYADASYQKPIVSACIHFGLSTKIDSFAKAKHRFLLRSIKKEKNTNDD